MATTDVASPTGRQPTGRGPAAPAPAAPSGGARLVQFYHDVLAEMKRVTWPDRKELQDATVQIIIFVLVLGAVIALMDLALQFALVRLPALLVGR